jgi:hypothetical protein
MGALLQDNVMRSMHATLSVPLESRDHTVHYFMPLDNSSCADDILWKRMTTIHGARVRVAVPTSWTAHGNGQGASVRVALDIFKPFALSYEMMLLLRYDVAILMPVDKWPCSMDGMNQIGLTAPCERESWMKWNCTNDLMWAVPRAQFAVFDQSVGKGGKKYPYKHVDPKTHKTSHIAMWLSPVDCFEKGARTQLPHWPTPLGSGHGCYNRLGKHVGYGQLEFCWATTDNDGNVSMKYALAGNEFFTLPKHNYRDGPNLAVYVNKLGLLGLNESASAAMARLSINDLRGVDPRIKMTNQTYRHEGNAWWVKYIQHHGR